MGAKRGHLEDFINMSIFLHSPKGSRKAIKNERRGPFAESVLFFLLETHLLSPNE